MKRYSLISSLNSNDLKVPRLRSRTLTRYTVAATLAGLAAVGSFPSIAGCSQAPDAKISRGTGAVSPTSSIASGTQDEWHRAMVKQAFLESGCFEATPPSTEWVPVPCATGKPSHPHLGARHVTAARAPIAPPELGGLGDRGGAVAPAPGNVDFLRATAARNAGAAPVGGHGAGADGIASTSSGNINWALGSFPDIKSSGENQNGTANSFSLQLNTNEDLSNSTITSLCNMTATPASCSGWVQFVYWQGQSEIWYNLLGSGGTCPSSDWTTDRNGNCYFLAPNTSQVPPAQDITDLRNMTLEGYASGAKDTTVVTTGENGKMYRATNDSKFSLNTAGWNMAQFDVFGDGMFGDPTFGKASFDANTTLTVELLTNNTTASSFDQCTLGNTTGESNNLTVVPGSCCPIGGSLPGIRFVESNDPNAKAPKCPSTSNAVCATSPNNGDVYRYTPVSGTWTKIGGSAATLYSGGLGLFATQLGSGDIWRYNNSPNDWTNVGTAGAEFAVTNEGLYGLSVARDKVWRKNDTGPDWTLVRGPAAHIYGGGYGLFATSSSTGDIERYDYLGKKWEDIGGPGSDFAVTEEGLYGLSPAKDKVWRYDGDGTNWTQMGGPASGLWGGGYGIFATNPEGDKLMHYQGDHSAWNQVGSGGADWAVTEAGIYGLTSNRGAVYAYDGSGQSWTRVGGAAAQIVPCP